jgi:hypothetical protein
VLVDGGEPLRQLQALTPANESVLVYTAGVYNSAYATHKFCDIMTLHSHLQICALLSACINFTTLFKFKCFIKCLYTPLQHLRLWSLLIFIQCILCACMHTRGLLKQCKHEWLCRMAVVLKLCERCQPGKQLTVFR